MIYTILSKYYLKFKIFIDDIRIYSYKDLYENHPNNISSYNQLKQYNKDLDSNSNSIKIDNTIEKLSYLQTLENNNLEHINLDLSKLDTINTGNKIYKKNEEYFCKIYSYMDKTKIRYRQNTNKKSLKHYIYKILTLKTEFCVLSPDDFKSIQIDIKKTQLKQEDSTDILAPLKAKNLGLIPNYHEYRYFVQNQDKEYVYFQIFCVLESTMHHYVMHNNNRMLFFNIFEIFSTLHVFFPQLLKYTIIFQDNKTHALCYYANGLMEVSILVDRKEALQNYYSKINDFGEMFYCNFTNQGELYDFMPIQNLFNMPLNECIKFLSIYNLYAKPITTNFYPTMFYQIKNKLKIIFLCVFFILTINLLSFLYNKYQYQDFINKQNKEYSIYINQQYNKKITYTPLYNRIYSNLLEYKSFNFCLKQDYIKVNGKYMWNETICNYKNKEQN